MQQKSSTMHIGFFKKHALIASIIFSIELVIAISVHDNFIRPFIGDVLVVILLFFTCKSFIKTNNEKLILAVLVFSFAIEIGQYFNLVKAIGLSGNKVARIIIGSTFDFKDLAAYATGAAILYILNRASHKLLR
jgi:hypothetical protein